VGEVQAPLFSGSLNGAQQFPAKAGEDLTKGDALYISGISGNKPIVMKADANDPTKMPAFGLADATVTNNSSVNCVTYGQLRNVDTTGYTLGSSLYVSTTPGALATTAPAGESALIQNLGKIERISESVGAIFVAGAGRTNATPNLDEGNVFLGDVNNQSAASSLKAATSSSGFIETGSNPVFTYTDSLLTSIAFDSSKTKTLTYNAGILDTSSFFNGQVTVIKTFNYTDGILTSITES